MKRLIPLFLCLPLVAQAATQRFLLLASANDGGPGKVPLRYSQSDARGFGKVLATLGGVDSSDMIILHEPDSSGLLAGLHTLSGRIATARAKGLRTEVVFYYSGHADENGLMLGRERLEYRRLRQAMDSTDSDVRLGVLDACASGGALRAKGGVRRPAFLTDESQDLRGRALLTSSTALENSHESDSLGGSFFTQALLTGLRGAADADRDGKVTLNEAYRFAYQETLRRTQESRAGRQHPSVDMDLSGAGDVVLTDLRNPSARLVLDSTLSGRLSVRDTGNTLVAEVQKWPGAGLELGLEPGRYRLTFAGREESRETSLSLELGQELSISDSLVNRWDTLATANPFAPGRDTTRTIAVNIGLMPPMDMAGEDGPKLRQSFALELALAEAGEIQGWQIAGGMATSHGRVRGAQIAGGAVIADGDSVIGAQASMVTISKGAVRGAQFGLVTVARTGLRGAQLSNFGNISGRGDFLGAQMSSVFNMADHGSGLQAAPGNWGGNWKGLQAGILNGAVSTSGAQVGLVNLSGFATGAQVGLVNLAHRSIGAGVGLVNLSRSQTGSQVGLVNLTDTLEGVQFGMVNLSRSANGLPIGLVNWSSSLPWHTDVWMDETGIPTVSSLWEWKWFHSQTDISSDMGRRYKPVFGYGSALGVQLPSDRWILSTDLGSMTITRGDEHRVQVLKGEPAQWQYYTNTMVRARVLAGVWALPRLGIFLGTGWTLLATGDAESNTSYVAPRGVASTSLGDGASTWPSLFAGVRLKLRR
ncbi:MAG: hypothetical protein RL318_2141 [Fibrobacterota bacterium]|jgi:hypothetical protein